MSSLGSEGPANPCMHCVHARMCVQACACKHTKSSEALVPNTAQNPFKELKGFDLHYSCCLPLPGHVIDFETLKSHKKESAGALKQCIEETYQ